jgi:hypothetical protein
MKAGLAFLFSAGMVLYVLYRAFVTFLIMPLTTSFWSLNGAYFVVLVLIAVASTVFSLTRLRILGASLAVLVGLAALSYWWFAICRMTYPIWSDFGWFVAPELGFSLAGICRWIVEEPARRFSRPA